MRRFPEISEKMLEPRFSANTAVEKRYQHIKLSREYCTDIKILVLTRCLFLYFALPPLLLDATSRATRSLYTCT